MADVEYHVEGVDSLIVRFRGIQSEYRQEVQEIVDDSLDAAQAFMTENVPYETGNLARSIDRDGSVAWMPGGLGGGGFWEGELTVGDGVDYLNIILEGSGYFGPRRKPIVAGDGNLGKLLGQDTVNPKENKKAGWYQPKGARWMTWYGRYGRVFAKFTMGQRPQTRWVEGAIDLADLICERKVHALEVRGIT